jgi:hypothetical protein
VIYQDPLAYLPGPEGIALLEARAEDHDRAFAGTRLAKFRRPLAGKKLRDRSERAERVSTVTAYKQQPASYTRKRGRAVLYRRAGRGRVPRRPGA